MKRLTPSFTVEYRFAWAQLGFGASSFIGLLAWPFPRFSRNFEMNSSELVTIVAEANDISKAQAQAILDSVLPRVAGASWRDPMLKRG